ncbi:MAPEG family protein [Phyllobacterium sp. SB3]|uniref:MAPEG family protein n=1 Tax=Phyllobacterium sp. SB3 TaxID=3156073 RepID=UPI0032AFAADA
MSQTQIFWPMIALTFLIYCVYLLLFLRRRRAVTSGQAKIQEFVIPINEPEISVTTIRNLNNLYEVPMLFYVVCLSLYAVNGVSYLAVVIAWLFVGARLAHTLIHVTTNRLRYRQPIFTLGFILNGILWIILAMHLLLPPV